MFKLNRKCGDFFAKNFDWNAEQKMLEDDTTSFAQKYSDTQGNQKVFDISEVTFEDAQGKEYSSNKDFKFQYSIGWMFQSNYPKCYQGTTLKMF
jgi:hypothetical protein